MTRLSWGELAKRNYEYGVDRGVFYPKNGRGYAWSGLTTVKETTVDASQSMIFVDGVGYANQMLLGQFAAGIEAITYPREFERFDGYANRFSAQGRSEFDFTYRTMQANGYKIHLVYNALAQPTVRNNTSLSNDTSIELFSWDLTTRPELIPDARASSHFVIDTTLVNPGVISAIEDRLYGTDGSAPDMPTVTELIAIFDAYAIFIVTPHGDGTATVTGPDWAVEEIAPHEWKLTYDSVIQIGEHTYRASSL